MRFVLSRTLLPLFIGVEQGEAGRWGGWRPVSRCSVTCGQGIQKRKRLCVHTYGVSIRGCDGESTMSKKCVRPPCTGTYETI